TTSNNKSCLSYGCPFNRGKCLGGSTSINHMLYTRGNRKDFDYNLPGWSWQDLKPYFLRYEGLQDLDRLPSSSKPYHNASGLMKLSLFDHTNSPWHSRIIEGYRHLNLPLNEDVNGESQIGVGFIPGYVHGGERMSTARAFLARDDVKLSLKVAKHALCTGVIIDDNNVARGVKVVQRPSKKTLLVYARKEVILSAGTVGTPHILMLSGVGPATHLKEMGIPIRADLPVGLDISDHIIAYMFVLVDRSSGLAGDLATIAEKARDLTQYATRLKGPLTSIGLVDIAMFANTHCYNSSAARLEVGRGCELPNLQIIHVYLDRYVFLLARSLVERRASFAAQVVDQLEAVSSEYAVLIMSPINLVPRSRGSIRLASKNPLKPPAIFPNFLSDARDVDEALRSISLVEDLLESPAFRSQGARILHLELAGCPRYEEDREGYWRCYVRHLTAPGLHAAGSAALGRVLDARLRVRGVARLRVADASAMPSVPRGSCSKLIESV
ncbi:Glucose dehydrogenase, partial [Operophtera brumata]